MDDFRRVRDDHFCTKLCRGLIKRARAGETRHVRTIKIINPITLIDNDPEFERRFKITAGPNRPLMNARG